MPIEMGTVLEHAARQMTANNVTSAHVVDTASRPVGAIDLASIISAMVTPTTHLKAA